jgi:hypothetical protein
MFVLEEANVQPFASGRCPFYEISNLKFEIGSSTMTFLLSTHHRKILLDETLATML